MQSGHVEAIFIADAPEEAPRVIERARAVAGRGLDGDRYYNEEGTFFKERKPGQDLTLIEAEALEALGRETGIELAPGDSRRNVVTRGLTLNDLVGRRFRIGDVECLGDRLCDPCSHLERLTEPGVLRGLAGRGGLRADIVDDGWIEVGASIRELPD